MADTESPLSGTPSGTQFGIPMVKVAASGSEVMAGISVDDANDLLAIAAGDSLAVRKLLVAAGLVGSVAAWPLGAAVAAGWISCQGQAISRTTYSLLFAVLGGSYGIGDGSTTFNLPDMRGRTIAGYPTGARLGTSLVGGMAGTAVGSVGGDDQHVQTPAELATHSHSHSHGPAGGGQFRYNGVATVQFTPGAGDSASLVATTDTDATPAGSSSAFNIVQPTILMQWMIFFGYGT